MMISPGKFFEILSLQWYFLHLEGSILVFSTAAPGGTKCLIACRNVDFPSLGLRAYLSRGEIARGTRMSLSCINIKRDKANFANNSRLQSSSLGKLTICWRNSSQKMAFLIIKICKK